MGRTAWPVDIDPGPGRGRVAGSAAMLGGVLLVSSTLIHAAKPRGCVADECATRAMRETGILDGAMMAASLLLIAIGAIGLLARARASGRFGRVGRSGVYLIGTAVAVLVAAGLAQAVFFAGAFAHMPHLVIPSLLLLIIGLVLLGIAVLRSGILPRWLGVALVIGAVTLVGYNEQTSAALMALPLGSSWAAVGYWLWSQPPGTGDPGDVRRAPVRPIRCSRRSLRSSGARRSSWLQGSSGAHRDGRWRSSPVGRPC